jgi:hypothetical protein
LYRINHPLALWITQQAKTRALDGAKLVFDYGCLRHEGQHAGAVSRQGRVAHAEARLGRSLGQSGAASVGCGQHHRWHCAGRGRS